MSAHQLHRMLDITYKTAWFMFHRIREAMKEPVFAAKLTGVVEADETYIGGKRKNKHGKETRGRPPQKGGLKTKAPVLSPSWKEAAVSALNESPTSPRKS